MKELSQREVLEYCIQNRISFAIYKLPGSNEDNLIIADEVKELKRKETMIGMNHGFIISPFEENKEWPVLFLTVGHTVGKTFPCEKLSDLRSNFSQEGVKEEKMHYADFNSYKKQFDKMFHFIKDGIVKKAILSRVKHVSGFSTELAPFFYYLLSERYSGAYTFMYYTPQTGLWSGASPELLLEMEGNQVKTVSLAGTLNEQISPDGWRNKELDEQQIVTDFIADILKKYHVSNPVIQGPDTVKAGKVSHLKTIYYFGADAIKPKLWEFVKDLHPTPAVCGLPKEKAMNVVLDSESHDRSYYAGFLGYVNKEDLSLFVNIRCLKFVSDGVDLYLGGGITIDSKAKEEWDETELKSGTLMEVLNDIKERKELR